MNALLNKWADWWRPRDDTRTTHELHRVELPSGAKVMVSHTADCIGAACPRPQLITMRILESMQVGEVLELVSDNPVTVETIPPLAMVLYSQHLGTLKRENCWYLYIKKGEETAAQASRS